MTIEKFIELPHHLVRLKFFAGARGTVIAFGAMDATLDKGGQDRAASLEKFYVQVGYNVVAVVPRWRTFYRTEDILEFLLQLAASGSLKRFPRTMTFGSSMGGYGACAFADVFDADLALAIAPMSTLRSDLVDWEDRWGEEAAKTDWTGPLHDAATEIVGARRAVIIYDRLVAKDKRHVARLSSARTAAGLSTDLLSLPGVGHKTGRALVDLDLLKSVTLQAMQGDVDVDAFRRGARARRGYDPYFDEMLAHPRVASSSRFTELLKHRRDAALTAAAGPMVAHSGRDALASLEAR